MANTAKPAASSAAEPTAAATAVTALTAQADQAIGFAKNSLEQVTAKSREAMEQGLKAMDTVTSMSNGNVDALLESSRAASGAFQSIAEEVAQYSKQSVERTTAAVRAMADAKTVPELIQVQSDFARTEFAAAIAETTRLAQTVFATMTAIAAPLQSRVMAVVPTKEA
jgi:phasin family protein